MLQEICISSKSRPWILMNSSTSGSQTDAQAAGITLGEAVGDDGMSGHAQISMTYTGDGWGHIGMGKIVNAVTYEALNYIT